MAVLLHRDMGIKVVQGSVRLVTVWPGALIQTLNLIVASAGSLLDRIPR